VAAGAKEIAFMKEALRLAARGRGLTSPNPLVGCVIVKRGRVISSGYHRQAGLDHAEVAALRPLGMRAEGATVYVTLEPCNHAGRTGPCTETLIAAGVTRVVAAMADPNPRVKGGGTARLRRAGIQTEVGLLEEEARRLNPAFIKWVTTERPLVTLKAAITLDGRLAAASGDSRWVSGEASRRMAHRLRAQHDAILVGARTVELDDPALTIRLGRGGKRDPKRIILDGKLSISPTAKAVPDALVITSQKASPKRRALEARGAEVVTIRDREGRVDLGALLDELGRRQITSLLIEGGGQVHGQFLSAGLVDQVILFIAPKFIGAGGVPLLSLEGPRRMAEAWRLCDVVVRRLGEDLMVSGRPQGGPTHG
jgi:diaminohydroxyphosphoribosylaminopyrimidine deaminase/5-amino-6-(5-phosphoribosylamino)uracil reductase